MSAVPEIGPHAYIDESGHRAARTKGASDHFVMAAAIVPRENLGDAAAALAQLRKDIGRNPGDTLRWNQIKTHTKRLRVVQTMRELPWLTVSSVVVCKRHLPDSGFDDDIGYLYTLRFLLERLSWFARDAGRVLDCTLAHVVRFKLERLRTYEQILRADPNCKIAWQSLDPAGAKINQPNRVELLQYGDLTASSMRSLAPGVAGCSGAAARPGARLLRDWPGPCTPRSTLYARPAKLLTAPHQ